MLAIIQAELLDSARVKQTTAETCADAIAAGADAVIACLRRGGKVLFCGNGGSAADAQHLATEFVSRLTLERRALRAVALTTDTSALTAIGNDYGFERVFARQLEALVDAGDVLIAISTSGNSPNVLAAARSARELGARVIGLIGRGGGRLAALCDTAIIVPSDNTQRIQEAHIAVGHVLCMLAEVALCG